MKLLISATGRAALQICKQFILFTCLFFIITSCGKYSGVGGDVSKPDTGASTGTIYLPVRFHDEGDDPSEDLVFSYNSSNLVAQMKVGDGSTVFTYNSANKPVKYEIMDGSTVVDRVTFVLNSTGQVIRTNDEANAGVGLEAYVLYTYNAKGQLITASTYDTANTKIYEINYHYDAAGNISGVNASNDSHGSTERSFEHDTRNGILKNVSYIEFVDPQFIFSKPGNVTKYTDHTEPILDYTTSYVYNSANYPTRYTRIVGGINYTGTVEYLVR